MIAPPILAPQPHPLWRQLRWLILVVGAISTGLYLAFAAETRISAFAAILAGVVFTPMLLWTRTWRHPTQKQAERRRVLHALLGGPLVTFSLVTLSSYEVWRNIAVRLFALGTSVGQLFSFVAPRPRQPGFPVAGIEPEVTPIARFYINGKNVTDPLLLAQDWELRITGLVRNPLTLTYAQLLAMPRTNFYATLRCVDNPVDGHLMSTAYWSGLRLADLLALAQPLSAATTVIFHAADQFAEPSYESVLLAYAMNGETLAQAHGEQSRVHSQDC